MRDFLLGYLIMILSGGFTLIAVIASILSPVLGVHQPVDLQILAINSWYASYMFDYVVLLMENE